MLGLILSAGLGSRLGELTTITNKHLLPIYNKSMIMYPIDTLIRHRIKDIAIIVSGTDSGKFIELLQNGEKLGLNSITYLYQNEASGIAGALLLAEKFAKDQSIAVILGDNTTDAMVDMDDFATGARVYLKQVKDPARYGVPTFDNDKIVKITEKPKVPASDYAVTGLYLYDNKCFEYIKTLTPSARGELEISDLNQIYIDRGELSYRYLNGYWQDAGTFDSLHEAGHYYYNKHHGIK